MKTLILLLFFAINAFSQSQSANSYITIVIEPYTIVEVNDFGVIIDKTENGAIVNNIEISVRNNTTNKTTLSAYVTRLYDSTEIKARIRPINNNNVRILGEQWIDVNNSNFASDIEGSNTFQVTYLIMTNKNQDIQELIESIKWILTVNK